MALPSTATSEPLRFRAVFRVLLIAFGLLVVILPHLCWRVFSSQSPFARLFLRWAGWCAGARIRVEGQAIPAKALYLANHVSWLDILILSGQTGCAFIAKAEMEPWPVLGWLARLNNSVFVARSSRSTIHAEKDAVQQALLSGQPLCLFPEGTTSGGRALLPFRSSLIAAVTPAPEAIQIQPVALDYGELADEIAWIDDESVGVNALRIMGRYASIPVRIAFLQPLDHADFADRKAIAAHSRAEIAEALGQVELREERLF